MRSLVVSNSLTLAGASIWIVRNCNPDEVWTGSVKDLEEGDSVDKEADWGEVSLVRMLYSTRADRPNPPDIMRARSVLRRRATDGGPFCLVFGVGAPDEEVEEVDVDALALLAELLLLLLDVPAELAFDPAGAA